MSNIPIPPPLIFPTKFATIAPKRLKTLNLNQLSKDNNYLNNDNINKKKTVFNSDEIINLNKEEIYNYLSVQNIPKKITKKNVIKNEENIYSYIENKNKYTTAFVLYKKYNLEKLNDILTIFYIDEKEEKDNMKYDFICNYEMLFTLNQIYPSPNEIENILKLKDNIVNFNKIDLLFFCLSKNNKFKIYIDNYIQIINIQNEIINLNEFYSNLNEIYINLQNNHKLRYICKILLEIQNFINKENKINVIINDFDFKNIENIIEMKYKNKKIFDYIMKLYIFKFHGENLLNFKDKNLIDNLIEKLINNKSIKANIDNYLSENYLKYYSSIESIIKNNNFKKKIKKMFYEDFYQNYINKNLKENIEKEKIERKKFIDYFVLSDEDFNINLLTILKIIKKLNDILSDNFLNLNLKIEDNENYINKNYENKENNINILNNKSISENSNLEKIENNINKNLNNINKKEIIKKGFNVTYQKKVYKYSFLSDKYNL